MVIDKHSYRSATVQLGGAAPGLRRRAVRAGLAGSAAAVPEAARDDAAECRHHLQGSLDYYRD